MSLLEEHKEQHGTPVFDYYYGCDTTGYSDSLRHGQRICSKRGGLYAWGAMNGGGE